jgi:selenide,water dikinase
MKVLQGISPIPDPNLLTGMEDDAGVYKLRDDLAIIVTIDFFTPIVKEAYIYGQIAAANALSDVYAMGGKPIIAMNVVCFPTASMDLSMLKEVLRGGADKLKEANVVLVGGHSVIDPEQIKYGLSVVGVIDPRRILTKGNLEVGDKLILTKALGTGIINNALKGKMVDEKTQAEVAQSMATLNKKASEIAQEVGIHVCTDVTGFGLAGHLCEMIEGSKDVGIGINSSSLPLFSRVEEFARMGLIPPGTQRNRKFRGEKVDFSKNVPDWKQWIMFDAQTSGGLVLSTPPQKAEVLLRRLHEEGVEKATIIGKVVKEPKGRIVVT